LNGASDSTPNPTTFAIVPAAGLSTRMGRPKLALPLGGRTVLEHVVNALRGGGVNHVIVIVGPHVPELASLVHAAGVDVCLLAEPTPDMRTTVERGLQWIDERFHPNLGDAWLLAPADHPVINADVVRQLLSRFGEGGSSIVVPVQNGHRGHPTVFAWRHVAGIRALAADQGINAYLRSHVAETLELPVDDPGVLVDLDTPEDYERLVRSLEAR
jgi:CTP:molybdopterin cytidylyltransferase MocA